MPETFRGNEDFAFGGDIVWRPTSHHLEKANLTAFMRQHSLADFDALMHRSTTDVAWFTDAVLKFLDIRFSKPYTQVIDLTDGPAWPQWCVGGDMNIVHNCLDKYLGTPTEHRAALIWEGEEGQTRTLTYGDLTREVNRTANALHTLGL
ncbi:MAG TPA: acetyl-coenzyme A synthetase N-terminal domain-containing protein, partial [Anaerolineales bacterium]|nr:acetyl-coenzyme A synthetase N-terminal domain-containing protein [Anaerolineales bacterium]